MFQIEKVSGFELSVLYSYPMRSAFAFVSGLKYGKKVTFVSDFIRIQSESILITKLLAAAHFTIILTTNLHDLFSDTSSV